jgi:BTB/POZ domain
MVWRHLEHIAKSAEGLDKDDIASFLSDLYSTYRFLQDNLDESRTSFTLQTSKVWLNLDVLNPKLVQKADLQSSWCDIDHIILSSSCDIGKVMFVREALMPFEKLLAALGCEPILYPTISTSKICPSSISNALKQMRTDGKLFDVTLVAEHGEHIRAHKVVLASVSAYFATQFNGNWSNNDIIPLGDFSHSTLSMIVDFAYADNFDWAGMQALKDDTVDSTADKLDALLDLLDGADRFDMPGLTAQVENQILQSRRFIRPDNVRDVQYRASQAMLDW